MSEEELSSGFRFKKKLKLAAGKSKSSKSGEHGRKNFDRSTRDSDTIARTASVEKAAWKGKQRTPIANVKRQRIYGAQNSDMKVTSFKSHSRRGHDAGVAGKSSDAYASSLLASKSLSHSSSQGKRSNKKQENDIRSPKVSYERRKTRGEKDLYVESVRKTHSKNTKDLSNTMDSTVKKSWGITPSDPTKKRVFRTTSANGDPEIRTDKSKKRKRVIRIDPYDVSNKRLDDGILPDENARQEKAKPEEKDEISSNAQFRAIQPSKSIISFVEDNLLGRRRMIELRRAGYNTDLSAPLDNIPFSSSAERERIEENVFRNKLTFFAAAKVSSSFPTPDLPEIAFAGRSNVGKSSLLNALTRQWGVARMSDKPGLTQTINFFNLATKMSLVDLPGYGFAYAKEEVKDAWEELVKEYIATRVGLKQVCLLIDTKWGMKPRDQELIDLMERSQTKYQIVLTKTDTVFPMDVARRAMQIEERFQANKSIVQPLMMVSSKSGAGIRSLRTALAKIARFAKV